MADITTSERRDALATVIGEEEAARIATVSLDIARMRELGVLVDIDIHGTSMFTARASWAELGIPREDTRRKRLRRGSKDLIPHLYIGRLRSLETRFRQSLERHSFVLQGFRPYRWVPFTAYEAWRAGWADLQAELAELKADILTHYDEFVDALAADFAQVAHEAWDAVRARRPAGAGEFALVTSQGAFDSLDAFTDHVVARAVAQMPSPDQIERGLYVDYKNALVVTGADLEAEHLHTEQLYTEQAQERTRQVEEWARQHKLRLEVEEAEQASGIRLAAMRQAELEHARRQLQNTVSPFAEVFEQFRARIYEDVQEIATSISRNGHVRGKVAERARGLLDAYRLLGAASGDDELEAALLELRARLNQRPANDNGRYDTAAVRAALDDIATLTHDAAQAVISRANAHTRASALEL